MPVNLHTSRLIYNPRSKTPRLGSILGGKNKENKIILFAKFSNSSTGQAGAKLIKASSKEKGNLAECPGANWTLR